MELGATVCKPANPTCGACPVAGVCAAAKRVAEHAAAGGDPAAEGAPRVTDYPEKVGSYSWESEVQGNLWAHAQLQSYLLAWVVPVSCSEQVSGCTGASDLWAHAQPICLS